MLTAHFRKVTPWTVEVRFFENGCYENMDEWIGSCNLHFQGISVEASMLKVDSEYVSKAVRLMRNYLKERGYLKYHYVHNKLNHSRKII